MSLWVYLKISCCDAHVCLREDWSNCILYCTAMFLNLRIDQPSSIKLMDLNEIDPVRIYSHLILELLRCGPKRLPLVLLQYNHTHQPGHAALRIWLHCGIVFNFWLLSIVAEQIRDLQSVRTNCLLRHLRVWTLRPLGTEVLKWKSN